MMTCEGSGKKQPWPNQGTTLTLALWDCRKMVKTSFMTVKNLGWDLNWAIPKYKSISSL